MNELTRCINSLCELTTNISVEDARAAVEYHTRLGLTVPVIDPIRLAMFPEAESKQVENVKAFLAFRLALKEI